MQIIAVADGRGVPSFLKKLVRSSFPKDLIFLMDWSGIFSTSYNCLENTANIMLFDPSGELILKFSTTEFESDKLQQMIVQVDKLINTINSFP